MGWLVLAFALTGSILAGVYRQSPNRRMRRTLARTLDDVEGEFQACQREIDSRQGELDRAAKDYADALRRPQREAVALEDLREAGARNLRWGALERGGIRTLADLDGFTAARLDRLKGVGPKTARRLLDAADVVRARLEEAPVPLPDAQLASEHSQRCATRALDLLAAEVAMGPVAEELRNVGGAIRGGVRELDRRSGFLRWLVKGQSAGYAAPAYFEAAAIHRKALAQLESGMLEDARQRREGLARETAESRGLEDLRLAFRRQYADACAVIEAALPGTTRAPRPAVGAELGHPLARHLPLEIAERVERFPLQVDGLRVTLRRYQAFGAKYLLSQERTILGDEMGLGKTIEALAAIVHRSSTGAGRHSLVVAPASVTRNWMREIERRTALDSHLLHGLGLDEARDAWICDGGIAVVSYATLRRLELDQVLDRRRLRIDVLVADEAHFLKNPDAGRTRAVTGLLARSLHVCLMSGTPMENHPREFCRLVDMVRPEIGQGLRAEGLLEGEGVVEPRRFHRLVAPVYLRRNQTDVLRELPPKVEMEDWVDVEGTQRDAYREAVLERNLMAMRRTVTLSPGGGTSAKMARLGEILEEHRESGRKVLVYSFFLPVLGELQSRFAPLGAVTGSVAPEERMRLVDAFQQSEGYALLIAQIRAGGVGLNLHAASVVVLMEPQWKPSTEEQAIARAHRMGQTESVLVHRLLARETVDERMVDLLEGKIDLFQAYARDSLVKLASREATESALSDLVLTYEYERIRQAV